MVVTSARGLGPRRSPICKLSQVASRVPPFGELVAPGEIMLRPAQPVRACRPKRSAPRCRSARSAGRCSAPTSPAACRRATLSTRSRPSTIMRRASSSVAPTSAIRTPGRLCAISSIHSAPARVLPKPRPAIISQVRQPGASGGSCASVRPAFEICVVVEQVGDGHP